MSGDKELCRLCGHNGIKKTTISDNIVQKFLKTTNITLTSHGTEDVCISCSEKAEIAGCFVESVKRAQINFLNHISVVPKKKQESSETVIISHHTAADTIPKVRIPTTEGIFVKSEVSYDSEEDYDDPSKFDADFSHNDPLSPIRKSQQTAINNFTCVYCKLNFIDYEHLVVHLKTKQCRTFNCKHCPQKFNDESAYKLHMKKHLKVKSAEHFADVICDYCGVVFQGRNALDQHIAAVHRAIVTKGISYTCNVCKNKCHSQLELIAHLNNHRKVEKFSTKMCEYCGKVCESHTKYVSHIRGIHLKPFICDYCGKHTTTKQRLLEHLHIHTRLKTFKCELCPNLYAKQKSLSYHRRKQHRNKLILSNQKNGIK